MDMRVFLEREIASLNLKIVNFTYWYNASNKINVNILIEKNDYVSSNLSECVQITKLAKLWLKNYSMVNMVNLSVACPSIERPLFNLEDFDYFKGQEVYVLFKQLHEGRKKIQGFIKNVNCDLITIENKEASYNFNYDLVDKANLVVDWKSLMSQTKKDSKIRGMS